MLAKQLWVKSHIRAIQAGNKDKGKGHIQRVVGGT